MQSQESTAWQGLPTLLREARERAGCSKVKAAEALGVRRAAIWEVEQGKRTCKAEELAILADLYGVSTSWLLGRASSRAQDDRASLAAEVLAHMSGEALDRLEQAIRIVKERRSPGVNLTR